MEFRISQISAIASLCIVWLSHCSSAFGQLMVYLHHSDSHPVTHTYMSVGFTCTLVTVSQKRLLNHHQPLEINQERHYWLMIAAQASHLLHHSHFCQPWQQTAAHCWESGRKTMLPVCLIPWHCFTLFLISDIHLQYVGRFSAGGFR